ncbi:hypothetical protein BHM03_00057463 [Ensete ventricosum]|nr:hypothetical protein BHM03_00057463 [Ensete ventricosum]
MFLQSYSPLVGNKAPDFEAEAVFDQEFINVSLCLITLLHLREPLRYELCNEVTHIICQGIALRGLFIIDKEGVIQHSTINNLAIGRSVDETMRTLQVMMRKS